MRILERLLTALLVLAAAVIVIGLLLPSHLVVSRSLVIDAPPARVYETINDVRHLGALLPLTAGAGDIVYSYPGPMSGVGARLEWQSAGLGIGAGSLEITAALEDRRIEMQVRPDRDRPALENWLQLQPRDGGTRVEWGMRGDYGWDLIGRYNAVLFDDAIGAQLARGLERLRETVAAGASTEARS